MANLSKIKRDQMIGFLEELKQQHNDDASIRAFNEIENHLRDKKYGLVWEEHSEEVDDLLKDNIPILTADSERRLCKDESLPWNFIIEGDNLQALYLLEKTHKGKVDCIYIDPPYNTGAKDWKYNNCYVDGNDSYRHSKWLSMMQRRLFIAKNLLNPESSVLLVTIDEKEYTHLGCLLEEMFPESDIQMISTVINPKGSSRNGRFSRVDEYIYVVYIGSCGIVPNSCDMLRDMDLEGKRKVRWAGLMRQGIPGRRTRIPSLFYPIFIDKITGEYHSIGEPLAPNDNKDSVVCPDGTMALFPINTRGEEQQWSLYPPSFIEYLEKGYIKFGKRRNDGKRSISYLQEGMIKKIKSGDICITGKDIDGSLILEYADSLGTKKPSTIWHQTSHSASENGTTFLNKIIGNRFSYPKSLYAVHDTIRFFVANKPDALIVDFFAGSGTTLHAINLLNAEDGGHRRCIMVTNNEIGETKENELTPLGFKPGDDEWERWGIAKYVNWPRTKCTILGQDINGQALSDEYITTLTRPKEVKRRISQISFMDDKASIQQKKSLVILINKQKNVKLPSLKTDASFIISDDDKYNASILFNIKECEAWIDALEGNEQITDLYIVTQNNTEFKKAKEEILECLGTIEEIESVTIPMREGFKSNVKYFKCDWTPRKPEDYLLSNALCLHIKEMIELQNAIEVDNVKNVLLLSKSDVKTHILDGESYDKIERVWVNQNIVLSAQELKLLEAKGYKYIPKEFFGQELKEAAE